ncbi:MAG: diadenylate cyclase CdaA [Mucispirillum sp.]|nr:diadenylate cyclase CdaA [Mucispirillum sp.]
MLGTLFNFIHTYVSVRDIIDIALISYIIYRILLLLRGTRAIYMLVTIIILMVMMGVSSAVGLRVTHWVLNNMSGYLFLALMIIFQPEMRRALAFIGESKFFERSVSLNSQIVDELVRSSTILANRQLGALIVIQRNTDLAHYVTIGQKIDSVVSKDLLLSIFIPYSPLHDGAVLLVDSRLTYAGCILPLTKRDDINQQYGTRHRAAIGVTEETDAVAIVVSEERGEISIAVGGKIIPNLDANMLKETLSSIFKNK